MIPEQAIIEWRREAPWEANSFVEQDLIISRALVEMYSLPDIQSRLAFRGGTALYKLYLRPAARYSEEINSREHFTELGLVQLPFKIDSQWFRGRVDITTFSIDELLGLRMPAGPADGRACK